MTIYSLQSLNHLAQFLLMVTGAIFLGVESYEVIGNQDLSFPWFLFVISCLILSVLIWIVHGFWIDGYLKGSVTIKSNVIDPPVSIEFGDLLEKEGWKAIGGNDFFDSEVDEIIISSNTLHGRVLRDYWPGAIDDWDQTVENELEQIQSSTEARRRGKTLRYPIGTTVSTIARNGSKFFFVALAKTAVGDGTTKANAEDIILAVRGLLKKARARCSNEPLYIPLLGSGLARTGMKEHLLLQLILIGIVEELKVAKVTSKITIILPKHLRNTINLGSINTHWK
ncbi:macro domain-containing protein [Roseovarius sp. A46]|uniref:macro domain-containing protein n=1 Tax=Roseovarius sp. A46 TaxID=2109331 RepID=UPI0010132BD3|nr:macro domain-containing protein [Roseovarius sp. A46]